MKKLLLMYFILSVLASCKKTSTNPVVARKKFQITVNSTDPLKIDMSDNDSLLVFQTNVLPPFKYEFYPKPGDQIKINIVYNNTISISESYDGKTDNAHIPIEVGNAGAVQYIYPIPE